MTLQTFIDNFAYKADGPLNTWRIVVKEPLGDCNDFAITAAYILSGESLVRMWLNICLFRMVFLRVHTGTEPHAVLKYKGQYIDNITKGWSDSHGYRGIFPWVFIPPLIAFKMLIGKIFNNG